MYAISFENGDEATVDVLESGAFTVSGRYASGTKSRITFYSDSISVSFTKVGADLLRDEVDNVSTECGGWAVFAMNILSRGWPEIFVALSTPGHETLYNISPMDTAFILGKEAE